MESFFTFDMRLSVDGEAIVDLSTFKLFQASVCKNKVVVTSIHNPRRYDHEALRQYSVALSSCLSYTFRANYWTHVHKYAYAYYR